MRKTLLAVSLVLAAFACKKHEAAAPATTQPTSPAAASTTPPATATTLPTHNGENLVALASGALPVIRASAPEQGGSAYYMFDEDATTGWTSNGGKFSEPTVVELADRGVIKSVEFDEKLIEWDGRIPREVVVEVSDTSAADGFKPIADVKMSEQKDGQAFPVSAEVPGRWVRLTVKETGSKDGIAQIMEFRAFGDRLTHNPMPANVSGTYETSAGEFHLRQEGATVTGCYDHASEPLIGGMEGRILKFKYAIGESGSGPALLIISDAGDVFGGWWRTDSTVVEHPKLDPIEGKRKSSDPGATACPQWSPEQGMAAELKKNGRVRLYGINFDSDSDVIRDESKPTLEQVASMLKSNADLKLTVEGHTDSTATPEHNQDLSTRRANSVKQYLVAKGIDATRLDAAGFGATKPVASNDSALGRAENRRVELAKK
jgi:outer membrane protein OmpA-like peptidoglycan-associated protein